MKEILKKQHAALRAKMQKHDEAILKLLKQGHREIVIRVIKDYLQQPES